VAGRLRVAQSPDHAQRRTQARPSSASGRSPANGVGNAITDLSQRLSDVSDRAKPLLRGWLHAGALPTALAAGLALVILAPGGRARAAVAIYAGTSVLLFATSALYHRGTWRPRTQGLLQRLDHGNIFLIIAGSYTPFAVLTLHGSIQHIIMITVWLGAAVGIVLRVVWVSASRWTYTLWYIGLGWVVIFILPQLLRGAGVTAFTLIAVGGLLYTAGAVVYALRKPNPAPRWFGFHEVFHSLTVAAWFTHYVALSLVTYRLD
jgi:hemolysin III